MFIMIEFIKNLLLGFANSIRAFKLDTPLIIVLTGTSKDGQSNYCRRENREWRTQTEDNNAKVTLRGK
jgi:hypothetical protein